MILLYHGIVAADAPPERSCASQALPLPVFVRHIGWIARRRRIVPLDEYLARRKRNGGAPGMAALTFDDGLAGTFERVEPFLRAEAIPATFFVATAHAHPGTLLWFTALDAICFEGEHARVEAGGRVFPLGSLSEKRDARRALGAMARRSGDALAFARDVLARHPLSASARDEYRGMTFDAMRAAASGSLFEIGSHTRTHPYLSRIPLAARRPEIAESRAEIERAIGRSVRYFAYPGGDYDRETLALVRDAGYEAALATVSNHFAADDRFEIERVGIYSAPLWKVAVKAAGVVPVARRLGLQIG